MIKPDAVQRGIVGNIISRFESAGLKLAAMKLVKLSRDLAEQNYAVHKGKPFYESLIDYVTSGPVVCMVLEGESAVAKVRSLVGATNPLEAAPGSIRGDFGLRVDFNIVHASDSVESAEREISVFFKPNELIDYTVSWESWL